MPTWGAASASVIYRRFGPGEPLVGGLEEFALANGIREAVVTSCIGSLKRLRLRNLCERDAEGEAVFERSAVDENLELVSAEGYIQPMAETESGIHVHIHVAAARPSGEMVGGHCEEATTYTGAFLYLHVLEAAG